VWLARQGLPYSRSQIRRRIEEGEVRVGGQPAKPSRKLRARDRVSFAPPPPVSTEDRPEDIPLTILYEDAHLIVIDKPAGMVVHPATSHQGGTLVNALLHQCGDSLTGVGGERRPGIVHRLDKDTSGVMVVAKDEPTLVALQAQFHAHTLTRRYLALVEGVVAEQGTHRSKYGRDPRDRKKFSSRVTVGKRAVTQLEGEGAATGRHAGRGAARDRAHAPESASTSATAGHPLVGDPVYGHVPRDPLLKRVAAALGRQALHAEVLGLEHPATGRYLEWSTRPPADLQAALNALRAGQ